MNFHQSPEEVNMLLRLSNQNWDVDTQELEAGDAHYFRPTDVDGSVSAAFRFPEGYNELFSFLSVEGEVVGGTLCC